MRCQDYSGSPESVWQQGENITCSVDPASLAVTVIPPVGFDPTKPVKLFTHGFIDTVTNDNTQFVQGLMMLNYWLDTKRMFTAWEDYHGGRVGVVLLDWANLAWFAQISDWDDFVYDLAARNSIDVGEFTGLCMAALAANTGLQAGQIHLVGHSLGAHLVVNPELRPSRPPHTRPALLAAVCAGEGGSDAEKCGRPDCRASHRTGPGRPPLCRRPRPARHPRAGRGAARHSVRRLRRYCKIYPRYTIH